MDDVMLFNRVLTDSEIRAIRQGANPSTVVIRPSAGAHGTILPGAEQLVTRGGSRTFAFRPVAGYVVADVRVDGVSVGAVSSYTFTDLSASHALSVTFKSRPPATTWKYVTPPAKFVSYAKHARKHGMQAWYPRRIPTGYVVSSISIGDMGDAGPYCDIVYKKGSRKIYLSQGTLVGADGELPARGATCQWGTSRADVYSAGSMLGNVVWFTGGSANGFAGISGSLSLTDEKAMAKTMRKVP
jgi:hypothetical protein